jgi:hypothetical protein
MWGNRLGWSISAVIAIVVIGTITFYARGANRMSDATPFGTETAGQTLNLAASSRAVIGGEPSACDAAGPYGEAIALYRKDRKTYDDIAEGTTRVADLPKLPALMKLAEGTRCEQMTLFTADPSRIVRYDDSPDLDALRALGKAAVRAGLIYKTNKKNFEAMKCYEAAFALGSKLYDDRLTYREMMAGQELMGEAGVGISKLSFDRGDTDRSDAAQKFDTARRNMFTQHVQPVSQKLISIDPPTVARHAGDVFYLAEHAKDRMWRVEAIFALGRMRYFVGEGGRLGDQRGATRKLRQLVEDKDPVIHAAAKAALDLTAQQMRMLG